MRVRRRCVRILVGTRTCSPERVLFSRQIETIADPSLRAIERASRELDNRRGTERSLNPPGPDRASRAKDVTVAVDERDIDRELHEAGVDAAARRQDQGRVFGQARTAEQAAISAPRLERRFDDAGDDLFVTGVPKDPRAVRLGEDRLQKPQDSWDRRATLWRSAASNARPMCF